MFGKRKNAGAVEEPTVNGWRQADLTFLAQSLTRDEPHIATIITGYRQMLTLDGEPYAYNVNRVGMDREGDVGLLSQKNEIFGFYGLRRECRLEGSFGGASGEYDYERLEKGLIGSVSITCTVGGTASRRRHSWTSALWFATRRSRRLFKTR